MLREIVVSLYLLTVRTLFTCLKLLPLQNKVTMIETIGGHSAFLYKAMQGEDVPFQAVFLKAGRIRRGFRQADGTVLQGEAAPVVVPYASGNPVAFFRVLYHLATAKTVIVDNYVVLLAGITFKRSVECIQLWHAVGGFKRTGFGDRGTSHRPTRALRRFRKVYSQFHKLAVGSEALAKIHVEAFGLPMDRMLRTGVPRTDFFFDEDLREAVAHRLFRENPDLQTKKVMLYVPTYRDGETHADHLEIDFDKMRFELGEEFVVMLRLHPAVESAVNYEARFPGFIYDYSSYPNVNELLLVADCLITDYSSVVCEYALLRRPMFFYLYDLEEYVQKRGLWDGYESQVPGPVAYTTTELIEAIRAWDFDLERVTKFANMWNRYSTGKSSLKLVSYITSRFASPQASVSPYQRGKQHEIDVSGHQRTNS